ncbi:trafficking protein particle complex subunit 5 [Alternaria burnsii]|uniref:Trafficking protein particle complex subunit 5 n=3 Tax=Alternaria TaxID=5598 RepID=A0A8H7AX71_9PLEO|nr:trafficking protein particle complex subunit 5 [Alternaria burnsii]KAF7670985.1 trafficking protein particle complex subunit 5 [Alternaria burnsii]
MASSHSTRNVVVVIGTGRMGLAVTPRLAPGKHVLLADFQETTLNNALSTLREEGISCEGHSVNIAHYPSVEAFAHAAHSASRINAIIHTAGLSLGSASAKGIYAVDLIGTANIIEASCLLRPREPPCLECHLATAPLTRLLDHEGLNMESLDGNVAYTVSRWANILRVQGAAEAWGSRQARLNSINPGVIATPQLLSQLDGPLGVGPKTMVGVSALRRMGTPDGIANIAVFLAGAESPTGARHQDWPWRLQPQPAASLTHDARPSDPHDSAKQDGQGSIATMSNILPLHHAYYPSRQSSLSKPVNPVQAASTSSSAATIRPQSNVQSQPQAQHTAMSGNASQGPGLRYPSNKKSIYDRNLNRSKNAELSRAAFAYLFIEMIAYAQKGAKDVGDLEQRLNTQGYPIGLRLLDLLLSRTANPLASIRPTRILPLLQFIAQQLYRYLFGRPADALEKSGTDPGQYMLFDNDPMVNQYISLPKELSSLNCAAFVAGIIEGVCDGAGFPTEGVTAHSVGDEEGKDGKGLWPGKTVFLIKFKPEVLEREEILGRGGG